MLSICDAACATCSRKPADRRPCADKLVCVGSVCLGLGTALLPPVGLLTALLLAPYFLF